MPLLMLKYYVQFASPKLSWQPWHRGKGCQRSAVVWLGDVFVVVYDVPSNFLQLIACNTNNSNGNNNNDNRHFLTASRLRFALFAFSFRATFYVCPLPCLDLVVVSPPTPNHATPLLRVVCAAAACGNQFVCLCAA